MEKGDAIACRFHPAASLNQSRRTKGISHDYFAVGYDLEPELAKLARRPRVSHRTFDDIIGVETGMGSDDAHWRLMKDRDLPDVDMVADAIHTLYERAKVFEEKFRLFREGCFALEQRGMVKGYGISHPWLLYAISPLDTFLEALPSQPECLYIRDVAILEAARGHGYSQALCKAYADLAKRHGLAMMALVSVYGTTPLWAKSGFEVIEMPSLQAKLGSYGPSARYMMRRVA